ncbi:MAG TPA: hypothetical protein VHN98_03640, partial [Acidimicrobiales bacterium]|nr:hypothetical protein [Acidimicrobiales bacterium]
LRTTDAAELIVDVDGPDAPARLVAVLTERGLAATLDGRRVVVTLESDRVYDVVRDALADEALPVRRLERRTASLEQVFLEAGA